MKFKNLMVMLFIFFVLIGCSNTDENAIKNDWDEITKKAEGTTVNFYGWGGDPKVNEYIDEYIGDILKEKYNITVNRVSMLPPEYIDIIETEKEANKGGSIDVVWINGNNFATAKDKGLLMANIPSYLPNYEAYVDEKDETMQLDFNVNVDGYEVPFGAAQFSIVKNDKKAPDVTDTASLLEYVKANKSRFTYPDPTVDFVGSAFVRNVIADIIGEEAYYSLNNEMSDEEILEKIQPAFDYLNEIEPYLWREGKTYPQSSTLLDNMYADNEVDFTMSYSPFHAASLVASKEFSSDTKTIILGEKSLGNTHYLSIADNSANKEGALVLINEILSIEAQLEKYNPEGWGDFPIFSMDKINDEDKAKFESVEIPSSVLGYDDYEKNKISELDAEVTARIDVLWQDNVLKK